MRFLRKACGLILVMIPSLVIVAAMIARSYTAQEFIVGLFGLGFLMLPTMLGCYMLFRD